MKINSRYLIETPDGYKDFVGIKESISTGLVIEHTGGTTKCTNEHLIRIDDTKFVQANTLQTGQKIGEHVITKITCDHEKTKYYDPVHVDGKHEYISGNVVHHNCLVIDECAFINPNVWKEFADSIFPSQSGLSWKKNIILSTSKGMNHFYELVKGAREDSNGFKVFEVDWKDVPRYKSDGSLMSNDEFKNGIVKKHGMIYFNQNYGCVTGTSAINIYDNRINEYYDTEIEEFERALNSQKTNGDKHEVQNRYSILTKHGYSKFDGIIDTGYNDTLKFILSNGTNIEVTTNHRFVINNKEVLAKNIKIGDVLETKKRNIETIDIIEGKSRTYDVLETNDHTYYANGVLNHNCEFLGSSNTLISAEKLKNMVPAVCEEIRDGKLNIYKYPEEHRKYIMTIDAAKDGNDSFAMQIVDITDFEMVQVATAKLQIDYLLMPEFIYEYALFYNKPYLIIENNEGAGQSIADQLYQDYDYDNIHFDKTLNKRKTYPGFRTTSKTRRQILQTMKLFIENDKLVINDGPTISEFMQFILLNGKYQADSGKHDDLIMSLAMVFVPFCNTKNFEDMKLLIKTLYSDVVTEDEPLNLADMLTVCAFDDGTDFEQAIDDETNNLDFNSTEFF